MLSEVRYTILVDNLTNCSDLICEHGLSILCCFGNKKLLVDTGAGEALFHNTKKMNINLAEVDYVVLTHGHDDHAGGLLRFLFLNSSAKVFLKSKAAIDEHFLFNGTKYINIGVDPLLLSDNQSRLVFVDNDIDINTNIYLLNVNEKKYPVYPTNQMLYVHKEGLYTKDQFEHELIIAIDGGEYVDVITGCSHSGIINMITTIQNKMRKKIRYLFGGFHTGDISKYNVQGISDIKLKQLASFLLEANIEKIFTMHCTGKTYYEKLKAILGDQIEYAYAGTVI